MTSRGQPTMAKKPDVDPRIAHIKYACTACGAQPGKDKLTVKKVEWATMGAGYRRLRVRTVAWLCVKCREADPHWTQEMWASPGVRDVKDDG